MVFHRLCDKHERLFLFVLIIVEIPELLLGLPPFDDSAKTGDGEKDLDVPVPAVPIRVLVPRLTNVLHALYKVLAGLGLGGKLADRHLLHICGDGDELI